MRVSEFELKDIETGKVTSAEVVSLFDIGNLNLQFYSGHMLKHLFNTDFKNVSDTDIVEIEANMLYCVLDIKKNGEVVEQIDIFSMTPDQTQYIVENLMIVNNTKFLVSYLGNIITRR